jgi:hypothetical protein
MASPVRVLRPPSPLLPLVLTLLVVLLLLTACGSDPVDDPPGPVQVPAAEEVPGDTDVTYGIPSLPGGSGTTIGEPGQAAGGSGDPDQAAVTPGGQVGGPTDDVVPPGPEANTPGRGDDPAG